MMSCMAINTMIIPTVMMLLTIDEEGKRRYKSGQIQLTAVMKNKK
jgi:hypothetical protein